MKETLRLLAVRLPPILLICFVVGVSVHFFIKSFPVKNPPLADAGGKPEKAAETPPAADAGMNTKPEQEKTAETTPPDNGGKTPPEQEKPAEPLPSNEPPPEDEDSRYRRMVVGTWTDNYQGKRTMTLNKDGTGTMVVELSGLKATLFAPKLTFEMKWAVKEGRLSKQTLKGQPAGVVQMILKTMGDRVNERILELTDKRLLLLDQNGKTQYDWQRLQENKTP